MCDHFSKTQRHKYLFFSKKFENSNITSYLENLCYLLNGYFSSSLKIKNKKFKSSAIASNLQNLCYLLNGNNSHPSTSKKEAAGDGCVIKFWFLNCIINESVPRAPILFNYWRIQRQMQFIHGQGYAYYDESDVR